MTKDGASLTLAVWQGSSVWGDIGVNLQKIETVAKQAADTNADLLVFPECFLTGYYKEGDLTEIAAQVDDRCIAALASVSETLDITLVVGTYELTEAGLYNSAFVFDPDAQRHGNAMCMCFIEQRQSLIAHTPGTDRIAPAVGEQIELFLSARALDAVRLAVSEQPPTRVGVFEIDGDGIGEGWCRRDQKRNQ